MRPSTRLSPSAFRTTLPPSTVAACAWISPECFSVPAKMPTASPLSVPRLTALSVGACTCITMPSTPRPVTSTFWPAARGDLSIDLQRAARAAATAERHLAGRGVRIAHAQRRGGESGRVDHASCADGDAVRVDQDDLAVRNKRTENVRRGIAQHPVDREALRVGLREFENVARRDAQALPVQDRSIGPGSVLGRV